MFNEETKSPYHRPLCEAKNFRAVTKVFDMEGELDAWIQSQQEKGYPTDLDTLPRKAGEDLAQQQQQQQQRQQQHCEKRKLEEDEKVKDALISSDDNGTKGQDTMEGPVAKKRATDVSHPTPADTPRSDGDISGPTPEDRKQRGEEIKHDDIPVAVTSGAATPPRQ